MKIAAVSHLASPDAPTGAEKSLAALAEALASRGHDVGVVASGQWCLGPGLEASGVEVTAIRNRSCWLVQWGPQPPATQILRFLRYRLPDPGYRRMMVFLDRFWPDVVYVNCLPQLKGAAAARALGLPVVWHVREILPPGRRRRWFAGRLRRDADTIVAVSHAVARWLSEEGLADRVTVVHNGCVTPPDVGNVAALRTELGLPATGVFVGFFAQIIRHKGIFDLVQASSRAMAEGADLHLVIAGEGPPADKERLHAAIAGAIDPDRVHLLAPVDDVWNLLGAVDIVAVPSLWPDPLPRTVMEAMAAERPVVAYDTGGIAEMVVDAETGFMVKPGDVGGLAERITRLAGDADLRQSFGAAAGRRARSRFSLDRYVGSMERILTETAARDQRARGGAG